MKHQDAYQLLKKSYEKYRRSNAGKKDSISNIARELDMPYTNAYNALMGKTNCSANTWCKLMRYLKGLEITI